MGSDMAAQMRAQIEADGGAGLAGDPSVGGVPGSEGAPGSPATTPPAAGPSTPDSGVGQGAPDTIPYARFKEVNDQYQALKGYQQLSELGYDPDSLGRLASFEVSYMQDPVGTVEQLVDNLDLPQDQKDSIKENLSTGRAEGESSSEPPSAEPALSPEDRQRLEYVDQVRQRDEQSDRDARLAVVVSAWDRADKEDGIETPEYIKLVHIAAAANSGQQFETLEQLANTARGTLLDYRSGVLGGAVQRTGRGGSPASLPSSPPAPTAPIKFKDMREASRAAEAAIQRGELPPMNPGG